MNIGGQELQALQQMRALQAAGFKTLLLCEVKYTYIFEMGSEIINVENS